MIDRSGVGHGMKRLPLIISLLLTAALCLGVTGCGAHPRAETTTISMLADSEFEKSLTALVDRFYVNTHIQVKLTYADSNAIVERIQSGDSADLVALDGRSPMDRLQNEKYVDNYRVFATRRVSQGVAHYTVAKPVSSRAYAAAQKFVDEMLSAEGKRIFEKNGYQPG